MERFLSDGKLQAQKSDGKSERFRLYLAFGFLVANTFGGNAFAAKVNHGHVIEK